MDERDFQNEMRAAPDEDVLTLAYADWLEERADPKAVWVRMSMLADALHPLDVDRTKFRALAEQCFQEHVQPELPAKPKLAVTRFGRGLVHYRTFGRQIVEAGCELPADAGGVHLVHLNGMEHEVAASFSFGGVGALSLKHFTWEHEAPLLTLLKQGHFAGVHSLTTPVFTNDPVLNVVLDPQRFPDLQRLWLRSGGRPPEARTETFRATPELIEQQLVSLRQDGDRMPHGRLFRAPLTADRLRRLEVTAHLPPSQVPKTFLTSWEMPELRELRLPELPLTAEHLSQIVSSSPRLETLEFQLAQSSAGVIDLPESVHRLIVHVGQGRSPDVLKAIPDEVWQRLTAFELVTTKQSLGFIRKLKDAPHLKSLVIREAGVSAAGIATLTGPESFRELELLDLGTAKPKATPLRSPAGVALPSLRELRLQNAFGDQDGTDRFFATLADPDRLEVYVEQVANQATWNRDIATLPRGMELPSLEVALLNFEMGAAYNNTPRSQLPTRDRFPDVQYLALQGGRTTETERERLRADFGSALDIRGVSLPGLGDFDDLFPV